MLALSGYPARRGGVCRVCVSECARVGDTNAAVEFSGRGSLLSMSHILLVEDDVELAGLGR